MEFWLNLGFIREVEQLPALARSAEELGFDGVCVPHRFAMPNHIETAYPYTPDGKMFWPKDMPFPEPWVALGAMAATTERIRLASNIYLMGLQDPFTAARLVATASVLSEGRVVCGVSAGWLEEEFELAGVDFRTRGKRLDELIQVVRKLWTGKPVSHEGDFFSFPEVVLAPAPRESIPIWCGGGSRPAMRRAAELGQGWLGLWYTPEQAEQAMRQLNELREASGRSAEPFEALIGLMAPPTAQTLEPLAASGITGIIASPWRMEDPAITGLQAKQSAMKSYADRWMR